MPRLRSSLPKYSRHKASGQAYVVLDGRQIYLGPHGSDISRAEYDRVATAWLANGRSLPRELLATQDREDVRNIEIVEKYLRHAESYYRRADGSPTSEYANLCSALKPLCRLYGRCAASEFGPLALKAVRQAMVDHGWCRSHVNRQIARIKQMFKWAAENELIGADVSQALYTVAGLRRGRSGARESSPVKPAPDAHVTAVLRQAPKHLAAMIQLQQLTGMRPGEVVIMRGCDLDTAGNLWTYTPQRHKTEHHGRKRKIYLGPRAQAVLQPFLKSDLQSYLFSPAEAEATRRVRRRAARTTPLSCGNRIGTNRKRKPKRKPHERYTATSYARAVTRACDQAFPPPEHLQRHKVHGKKGTRWETNHEWRQRLGEANWAELKVWQHEHRWSPNQLRHNAATFLRKEFGIEAARVVLGHSSPAVTEVYAELDQMKAADIMAQVG